MSSGTPLIDGFLVARRSPIVTLRILPHPSRSGNTRPSGDILGKAGQDRTRSRKILYFLGEK